MNSKNCPLILNGQFPADTPRTRKRYKALDVVAEYAAAIGMEFKLDNSSVFRVNSGKEKLSGDVYRVDGTINKLLKSEDISKRGVQDILMVTETFRIYGDTGVASLEIQPTRQEQASIAVQIPISKYSAFTSYAGLEVVDCYTYLAYVDNIFILHTVDIILRC